ncbi:MAG TPA: GlsB/YeaQ/YmgE family stress response membrane protein [Solibacterales bacterium]|nr:GlsB/YeaQ/YmgE family stress response membrane protein [Bryobacterales bacterium]
MPGRDPGGFAATIILGIAGAAVGGYIGRLLGWYDADQSAGFLTALAGALLLLAAYRFAFARRRVA